MKILFEKSSEKELLSLEKPLRKRIFSRIGLLSEQVFLQKILFPLVVKNLRVGKDTEYELAITE